MLINVKNSNGLMNIDEGVTDEVKSNIGRDYHLNPKW